MATTLKPRSAIRNQQVAGSIPAGGSIFSIGVWCDFDPTTFVPRANYIEAFPLLEPTPSFSPSSFVNTNIWTDTDLSNNVMAAWGAIAVSDGKLWSLGTAGYVNEVPPGNLAGLIVPNIVAPAIDTTCAFWIKATQSMSPEFVAQIWGSTLVSGSWTTPVVIYDLIANPPAGYTIGNHSLGSIERLQAIQAGVCRSRPVGNLYFAS